MLRTLFVTVDDHRIVMIGQPEVIAFDVSYQGSRLNQGSLTLHDVFTPKEGKLGLRSEYRLVIDDEITTIEFEQRDGRAYITINRIDVPAESFAMPSLILEVWFPMPDKPTIDKVVRLKNLKYGTKFVVTILRDPETEYCEVVFS